jgi:3-hydroxy-D-aspartate aldolase
MGRTGAAFGDSAISLVDQIVNSDGLAYAGLQCYAGNLQHLESPNERRDASLSVMKKLADLRDALTARGLAPGILSGGGTGTFDIDPDSRTLTEIQVCYYVFMDRQYNDVWQKPRDRVPFETALFVQTTVISANRDGLATTDAGFKAFATDAGVPLIATGAPDGASYFFFGDEQGGVLHDSGKRKLRAGDVLACIVPHCDPTVNLYDCFHAVRGDMLEAIWPIEARGRSA